MNYLRWVRVLVKASLTVSFILLIVSTAKVIVGDYYFVGGSSMENTIMANSFIFIDKYTCGAILPRTSYELPIFSTIFKKLRPIPLWRRCRLPGIGRISRNDVVLVEHGRLKILKRVVGMPGDTLCIWLGVASLNGTPEPIMNTYFYQYLVHCDDQTAKKLRRISLLRYLGQDKFLVSITGKYLREFLASDWKTECRISNVQDNSAELLFPRICRGIWTRDNYGRIIVPKRGLSIRVNYETMSFYKAAIERFEGIVVTETDAGYSFDGVLRQHFTFQQDYIFLLGDNRMESLDSRYLGFFSVNSIIGRVAT